MMNIDVQQTRTQTRIKIKTYRKLRTLQFSHISDTTANDATCHTSFFHPLCHDTTNSRTFLSFWLINDDNAARFS